MALKDLKDKNYQSVIMQELVDYDYECGMSGFVFNKNVSIPGYIVKKRIWPLKKGSLTFGIVTKVTELKKKIEKIEYLLKEINYNGIFDIEFFVKNEELYLNEINFRNGGLSYLYGDAHICYYWYLSCIKNEFIEAPKIKQDYYVMDELAEIHNIKDKNITVKQYLSDLKKSKKLLVFNKHDLKPSLYMFINKLKNNIK